jgi:hypothetical protein
VGGQFGARFVDDLLGVLLGQVLKPVITVNGFLNGGGLIVGDVTGKIFAVFPDLELVVGPFWALAHDGKFAPFHAVDLSDLLEQLSWIGKVHPDNIY